MFSDENFIMKHDTIGVLGMANTGPHSNGTQFYITLGPAAVCDSLHTSTGLLFELTNDILIQWMDCKYVAFGRLIDGLHTLKAIEKIETLNERPLKSCIVANCGKYEPE